MTTLALILIGASALADEPTPAALVGLLASSDRVEREEAARSLDEIGPAALPALHEAEKAGPDLARTKARFLARVIEGRMLDRPTLVTVDPEGQPLEDAIRTLAARSGHAIQLDPGDDPALLRRPITVKVATPIPFWEALDAIGRAGHVRHNPGASPWEPSRPPLIHLADGEPPASTLYQGPFRIHLVGLHDRRDVDFRTNPGGNPAITGVFYVDVQAFVEPGRFLDQGGMPRIEAIDDQGHPVPSPPANAEWPQQHSTGWDVPGAIGVVQWRVPLGLPDPEAVKLRSIQGKIPVIVSATRPDPLVIPLDDPPGKTYRFEETTLQIRVLNNFEKQMQIEVTLTEDPSPSTSLDQKADKALRHRFAFEDGNGRPLTWMRSFESSGPGPGTRLQMTISKGTGPVRLRFHGLVWSAIEIPFEFRDVPLP